MVIYGWRVSEIDENDKDWLVMYNVDNQFADPHEASLDMFKAWEKFKKCPNYDEEKGYRFKIVPVDNRKEL